MGARSFQTARRPRLTAWSGLSAIALLAVPPVAQAGRQEAKERFQRAELDYRLGRFERALRGYERAYEAEPLPAFLFNIGQCHMELRNYDRAIFFFEGYLRDAQDGRHHAIARSRLNEAKQKLPRAPRQVGSRLGPATPPTQPRERGSPKAVGEAMSPDLATPAGEQGTALGGTGPLSPPGPRDEPSQAAEPFYKSWWFWGIVGGVVVAGSVTAIVLTTTRDKNKAGLPEGDLGTIDLR